MRVRGAKTELEEAGLETEGMVESTAKLREEILALSGVDIMEDADTFKSTYQMLDELAVKWEDLTDIQQASITELIAGKRQGNIVSSLMTNFDTARDALETSLNSSGSAMQEHEKWQESLEAQINKLKASWQSLSQAFLKSDFLKGALDGIIGLLDGLTKLIDTFGTLPTLAGLFMGGMSLFGKGGFFKTTTNELTGFANGITTTFGQVAKSVNASLNNINVKNGFRGALINDSDIAALKTYHNELSTSTNKTETWNNCMATTGDIAQDVARSNEFLSGGLEGYIQAQQAAEVSTLAQNKSLGSAKVLMKEYQSACDATGMSCTATGMSQQSFADAVAKTNPHLANAMMTTKTSAGGMLKYTASLIGAKVGTLALNAATMALNMTLTMGLGLLISKVFEGLSKIANESKEVAEQVEEVTSKFQEQHNELLKLKSDFDTSSEDSMISKYEKLSKGVDGLGRNVSLTADEYSEYQDIVNQIAEQVPSLVSGYDQQGNAILSCKGNVEELTEAYEKLIHAQNRDILINTGTIEDTFKESIENASGEHWFDNNQGFWKGTLAAGALYPFADFAHYDLKQNTIDDLQALLDANESERRKILDSYSLMTSEEGELAPKRIGRLEIQDMLESAGYEVGFFENPVDVLEDMLKDDPQKLQEIIDNYYAQFNDDVEKYKTIATAKLSEAFDVSGDISHMAYNDISEELQSIAYQTVGSLDYEFLKKLSTDGKSLEQWTTEMLDQLNALSKSENTQIEAAFDLKTKFNGGEISYGKYISGLNDVESVIDSLDVKDEVKEQLKISLDLDENGAIDQYKALVKRLTDTKNYDFDISKTEAQKFLGGLSSEEFAIAVDVITEMSNNNVYETVDQIRAAIDREMAVQGLNLDLSIQAEKTKLDDLTTAVTQSFSGVGLSIEGEGENLVDSMAVIEDMFRNLEGYDPSKLFERTSNGIRLNSEEFRRLNSEYHNTNIDKINKEMDSLGDIYNQTREELSNLTYGTKEYDDKAAELSAIEDRIRTTETLAAQYQGLASAYQTWQAAESAGSQRDMYEKMLEGLENVDDEISRGWLDDGTIEFLRLIKGENLSATATTKELKEAYKSLDDTIKHTSYSVRDFFTVDEDGNSTNAGVYNFLDAIGQMEEEKFLDKNGKPIDVVKRDKKTGNIIGFDFQVAGGDKAVADALGISEELVQIMVRAADDAGFVVSMDGTYQQLDVLKEKAQDAANKLKEIGATKFQFDLNTGDEGSVLEQYGEALKIWDTFKKNKNADGTVNMDVEGARDAYTLVSTLQSMVDKLGEPVYMKLDATQVEKDMKTPLSKLQEYEQLVKEENQLKLKGTDTSEIDKSQEEILDYFEGLSPEIKAQLGIEKLTREELQQKIESGEIEIPATVDLQVEMNDTLRDMVNVALYNAGLIDGEELEKRVDISLYADDVDATDVDTEIDKVIDESDLDADKKVTIKAFAEVFGAEKVDDLDKKLDDLDENEIKVLTTVLGKVDVDKLKTAVDGLDDKTVQAIAEALGKGDVDGLQTAIKNIPDKKVAKTIAEAFGYEDVAGLCGAIGKLDDKTVKAIADALGIKDVDSLRNAINRLTNKNVKAVAAVSGKDKVDGLKKSIDNLKGKTITIWAQIKKKASELWDKFTGGGGVDGTAHVNGTAYADGTAKSGRAFKQGDWGTKDSGVALGGEEAPELLVRNGRWHLIGEKGAEFFGYRKGDIIFNASQTKEIFEKGKITHGNGRGKALVSGTAFAGGSVGNEGLGKVDGKPVDGTSSSKDKNSSSSSDKSEEFKETLDFVEIAISRIERAIDQLDRKANSTYKSWSERNKALTSEIGKVGDEIELQQSAYNRYMQQANSVGLSESWASKIRNGSMDISTITDEDLKEKIDDYQKFYEAALECQDAIEELKETELKLYRQRFDNVQAQYDGILQGYEHTETMLNEYIAQSEAQGHLISTKYYDALIDNEEQRIVELQKEQIALIEKRNEAVANGISRDSEEFLSMCAEIDSVTQAIEEGTTAIIEYNNSIRDIEWQQFDLIQERISDITAESEFLIELMSNKKLFDDNGKFTEQGTATVGLHALNYNTAMYQADDYGAQIAKLDTQIAKDPYDQELINRRRELVELQRESILAAEGEKNAIKDLVEEGINLELDALQEKIDLHNKELDSMKDLYDYQKKVKEQTEEIASLEKQMAAYSNDDSEETKAKVQELKVSLEEAKADLEETEYEKYISDQKALLDELYLEYETILNSRLDNIDALLEQVIAEINIAAGAEGAIATALGSEGALAGILGNNATTIKDTLVSETNKVGVTLSNAMNGIWSTGDGNAKSVLTMYGQGFQDRQTTTNTVLNNIKSDIGAMVDDVDKNGSRKVAAPKTTTSAKKDPVSTTTSKPATKPATNTSGGDGKPKVGDKVKFVSGKYYYDSEGKKPLGSKNLGKQVYITKINTKSWATHPYHISTGNKLGSGDLGWLKLSQISGYATGKKNVANSKYAWTQENGQEFIIRPSDGAILTPVAQGDSVLNAMATGNIWNMANNPAKFIKENLKLDSSNIPVGANVNNTYTQHIDKVVFDMENVKNYDEMLAAMRKDKNFERLLLSMTINRIAGKSGLAKNKSIR